MLTFLPHLPLLCLVLMIYEGQDTSVGRVPTGWTIRGSNPGGSEIFRTRPDRPWGPLSLLYNGYRVIPGGKGGRGVVLTTHPHLVLRYTKKSRAILCSPWEALTAYNRMQPWLYFTLQQEF